jgi:hypothetical protein
MQPVRTVRQLRIRAPDEAQARRGRLLLEDALRTASLPGQGGALVLVRWLRLPAFRACATPQSVAIVLEAHCRNLAPLAVSGRASDDVLEAANALRFHDVSHACRELTDRLLRGERPRAWCWSLAVKGYHAGMDRGDALRAIVLALADQPDAPAAIPRWLERVVEEGEALRLLAALTPDDATALLRAMPAGVSTDPDGSSSTRPAAAGVARMAASEEIRWGDALARAAMSLAAADARRRWFMAMAFLRPRFRLPQPTFADARPVESGPPAMPGRDEPRVGAAGGSAKSPSPTEGASGAAEGRVVADLPADVSRGPAGATGARRGVAVPGESAAVRVQGQGRPSRYGDDAQDALAVQKEAPRFDATVDRPGVCAGEPQRTLAGGLLFLVPLLEALGFPQWLAARAQTERAMLVARVLGGVLDRLRVAPDDPVRLLTLADAGTRLPATDRPGPPLEAGSREVVDREPGMWLIECRRRLRRDAGIGLASLVLRRSLVTITPTHVDLWFPLDAVDIRIRRAGLDVDPGWVPWLGRVVLFHYGDPMP